jgi:hypothetical protein
LAWTIIDFNWQIVGQFLKLPTTGVLPLERFKLRIGRMISRTQYLRFCHLILLGMSCCLFSGCFEDTKQEVTLNPDGSGKMLVESTFIPASEAMSDDTPTSEAAAKEAARNILTRSEGIEVWRDVTFSELKDGSFFFRGTAYFPDLSKVNLDRLGPLKFSVRTDSANNFVLGQLDRPTVDYHHWNNLDVPEMSFPTGPITPESIRRDRRRFKAFKPMMLAMSGNLKQEVTFHVPGVVQRSANFEIGTPGVLRIHFNGERMVKVLEEMISNDNVMQSLSAATPAQREMAVSFAFNEMFFGEKSIVQAIIRPDTKPVFDYRSEVAAALKEFPTIARKVGMPDHTRASTPQPSQPITAKVTGIGWQFGTDREEYALNLTFQLPVPVLYAERVDLEAAQTIEGLSLLQDRKWNEAFSGPSLQADKTTVVFNAKLKSPPLNSRGIGKVAGVLHCASTESVEWIELFNGDLVAGATGSRFGVAIHEIQRPAGRPEKVIVESDAELDRYHSFRIEGSPGQFVGLETEGKIQLNGMRLRTFIATGPLPKRGRILVEESKDVPTLKFPFVITDLTLLGRPITQK